jgi:putative ABC transport system permease protein
VIDPNYFKTLGIPLLKGRFFTDLDKADGQGVIIIDEDFANRFWPNGDPIGNRIKTGGLQSQSPWLTVVGVVGHIKHYGLNEKGREQVYFPYSQRTNQLLFRSPALRGRSKQSDQCCS